MAIRLSLLLGICCSLLSSPVWAGTVTISGTVDNAPGGEVVLRFTRNFITYEEVVVRASLNDGPDFRFEAEVSRPTEAQLEVNGQTLPLFLEPDQQQYLTFNYQQPSVTVKFSGDGAAANRYLGEQAAQFGGYDMAYLQYELAVNTPLDYRYFMDRLRREKLALLQTFQRDGSTWSTAFGDYARAEIDYWWAFHLMRYRYEHPLRNNLPSPETLPYSYYDFLHIVALSNDAAMSSPHYSYFIDLFVRFVRENPIELVELSANEPDLLVTTRTIFYFDGPLGWPMAVPLERGERLHSVGAPETAGEWRRVRTYQGILGRVPSTDLKDEDWAVVARTQKPTEKFRQSRSSVRTYLRSRWNELRIYRDPFAQDVMAIVHKGFEAPSQLGRTTDKLRYTHQNRTYLDHYLTIEMPSGETGWVFRGGVNQQDRVETRQEVRETEAFTQFTIYKLAKEYLDGKVLQYALAKDIFLRSHVQDAAELKEDVDYFLSVSEEADYRQVVQAAYADADAKRRARLAARADSIRLANTPSPPVRRVAEPVRSVSTAAVQLPPNTNCNTAVATTLTYTGKVGKIELTLYADPVLFQEARYTLSPDAPELSIPLTRPTVGLLKRQGKEQRIYLEPGDALQLGTAGFGTDGILYSGKGAANNEALRQYDRTYTRQNEQARTQVRYAQSRNFRNLMDELYAARQSGLKALTKGSSVAFRSYLEADADYWYGYQLFNYPWEHPIYHNRPAPMPVTDDYYSFLERLPINRDGALPNMNYTYFLEQYLDYQKRQAGTSGATVYTLAEQYLSGEARTFFEAKRFVAACRRGQARSIGEQLSNFLEDCSNHQYDQLLRYVYNEAVGLRTGSPAPDFTLTDIDGREVSLSDFKGKVVYIDFWATWCAPCIRYMHHGKKLRTHYADENIVFLYVCLDKEADKWERYVKLNGLTGVHVAATTGNAYHSQVARLYKVSNLPTYYLIDQAGNVAENPAASPGSSAVRAQIDRLLYSR